MTTFEITIIVLLATIVVLLIVLLRTAIEGFHGVWQNQSYNYNELRKIVVSTSETLSDISQQLDNIEDNILDDLRDICIADKLGNPSPNVPIPLPCYAPNGICTNPQMDCINCPKRGTGGTWSTSTSIKAKDAVDYADALAEELKCSDDVYAECRRMDAINTASVCENMIKIQKELQKKGGNQ